MHIFDYILDDSQEIIMRKNKNVLEKHAHSR